MVSTGKNVVGFQAETRTRNQKASKEPKKHLLCWPLTFASVSSQNDFLGSSIYTVTGWLILGPMKNSPERSDWLTLADTSPSLIKNHGDRVTWCKHGFLSI